MAFTFNTSGSAKLSAGANVNSTIIANATQLNRWSDEIESICCNEARYDLVTNYASVTANGQEVLSSIADAYIAQKIVAYEPESIGITGASLRLNVLQNQLSTGLNQIKEDKVKKYLNINL